MVLHVFFAVRFRKASVGLVTLLAQDFCHGDLSAKWLGSDFFRREDAGGMLPACQVCQVGTGYSGRVPDERLSAVVVSNVA